MNLSILRRTAAEIAAAAVYELYPDIELLGGGETQFGFFYEFIFPHPIHSVIIEEKMRQIVKERRPIESIEMVPFSAKELLRARGQHERANSIEIAQEKGLVELIRIGDFYDLSAHPHLKNTFDLSAFSIECEDLGEKQMRLSGVCHRSKKDLKEFLKKLALYQDPFLIGEKRGFWKGDLWLESGICAREKLLELLKTEWFNGAFEVSSLGGPSFEVHRSFHVKKVAEIWGRDSHRTSLQMSFFNQSEEELNSSLQMIGKTLTILGFDHSVSQEGAETDFVVKDGVDHTHSLVRLRKRAEKGKSTIDFSIELVVEKILLRMLEKNLIMVDLEN